MYSGKQHSIPDINFIIGKAHSKLIECPILATQSVSTQIKIPDQPDLRYARIVALETVFNTDLAFSQPSGYQNVDGVQAKKISLVLETNDPDDTGYWKVNPQTGEPIVDPVTHKPIWIPPKNAMATAGRFSSTQQNQKYLPLVTLHRIQNAGSAGAPVTGPDPFQRDLQTFYNMYVSWNGNTYLQMQNGGLGNVVNQAVSLIAYYSWLDINGMPIPRN